MFSHSSISVDFAKCVENFHKFTQYTHFLSVTKNDLCWLNNLFIARFQLIGSPLMLRTNYRCVQSVNISVYFAKYVENFHKFTQYTHFLFVTKNDLSWLNNLFIAMFQLIRMSSYAENKLLMCSVTQHQCRHHQMCGKVSQFHPVHSLFCVLHKWLVLTEQSVHGKISTQ